MVSRDTMNYYETCQKITWIFWGVICFMFCMGLNASFASTPSSSSLSFVNPTLISGTGGAVNAVYKFSSVTDGVDAQVTLSAIYNGASMGNVDIPSSTTGYNPAFQPTVTIASGSGGNPKTSYLEWQIRFKKAGTSIDTTIDYVSATAIDVDGNNNIQERVQAYTPSSYSVNSPTQLTVTTDGVSVTALGSTTDYSGMDSSVKAVMFQMNFENVNLITYRTGGVNKSSSTTRQFSIYFKAFFVEVTPLPVELVYFNATVSNKMKVDLNWGTASESNNSYFTIERSRDGEKFDEIVAIPGAGNSSTKKNYSYTDPFPVSGKSYYRLIQSDYDGFQKIYSPVSVNVGIVKSYLSIENVYPNPFKANTNITVSVPNDDYVEITILNAQGLKERTYSAESVMGMTTWNANELSDLESGLYFLQATQNGSVSQIVRVMKN